LPLKFVGGDLSLDFINTVDWTPSGLQHDRLVSYARLVTWASDAGVVSAGQATDLRAAAARDARKATAALEAARRTRWVLHEVFQGAVARHSAAPSVEDLAGLLQQAHEHLTVVPARDQRRGGRVLKWAWRDTPEHLECMLWPLARAAADLLTSPEAARVRMCAGPDCGWLYVDRSRNGLRRWCEMQTCGTLSKTRRRAERRVESTR
jgi:predicted RNA-binding Zn ribbon-like protein